MGRSACTSILNSAYSKLVTTGNSPVRLVLGASTENISWLFFLKEVVRINCAELEEHCL